MRIRQNGIALLAALGLGATAMYFLDPRRGQVRRNEAQGRGGSRLRGAGRGIRLTGSLLRDRARGAAAGIRHRLSSETVADTQLTERVRAELGHHAKSLHQLDVLTDNGAVTLRGAARGIEPEEIVAAVGRVRGVQRVHDEMDREMFQGNG